MHAPWREARELLVPDDQGTVSFTDLAVWMHKYGSALLDVAEAARVVIDEWNGLRGQSFYDALGKLENTFREAEGIQEGPST